MYIAFLGARACFLNMKMPGTSIFTFPRMPHAYEDPFNIRKDIIRGGTRTGTDTLFVRLKIGSVYHDRCCDVVEDINTNDRRRKKEQERERTRLDIQRLEELGYTVVNPPEVDERNVRFTREATVIERGRR